MQLRSASQKLDLRFRDTQKSDANHYTAFSAIFTSCSAR